MSHWSPFLNPLVYKYMPFALAQIPILKEVLGSLWTVWLSGFALPAVLSGPPWPSCMLGLQELNDKSEIQSEGREGKSGMCWKHIRSKESAHVAEDTSRSPRGIVTQWAIKEESEVAQQLMKKFLSVPVVEAIGEIPIPRTLFLMEITAWSWQRLKSQRRKLWSNSATRTAEYSFERPEVKKV